MTGQLKKANGKALPSFPFNVPDVLMRTAKEQVRQHAQKTKKPMKRGVEVEIRKSLIAMMKCPYNKDKTAFVMEVNYKAALQGLGVAEDVAREMSTHIAKALHSS